MAATQYTTINRSWSMKMYIFLIVLLGFGTWSLLDALVWYPDRGIDDASFKERAYLELAAQANKMSSASIADPKARLAELKGRSSELAMADVQARSVTPNSPEMRELAPRLMEYGAMRWLDSLRLVGRLDPKYTTFSDPLARLNELRQQWTSKAQPKELSEFDIPLQWLFAVLGFGLGLWILVQIIRVKRTRYGWDPANQELTLPDGRTILPKDLKELDKRKWDKFYVTLELQNGQTVTLDLLRYVPLEDWILLMEQTAFPSPAESAEGAPAETRTCPFCKRADVPAGAPCPSCGAEATAEAPRATT